MATQLLPLPVTPPRLPSVPTGPWTRLSPARLDRLLAAGVDADASRELRHRSRVLAQRRRRERLAADLERVVTDARKPPVPLSSAIPVQRAEVRATRTLIFELAARIRGGDGARPAGLILARRLLTDGTGPLFAPCPPDTLRNALEQAILGLGDVRPQP